MNDREKYGLEKTPLVGTRLLGHPMEHFQAKGNDAHALIVINDVDGTFIATNVYNTGDGNKLGRGYTRVGMTHPLPADGDEKWKTWRRRGYAEYDIAKFDVIKAVAVKAKAPKAPAPANA